MSASSVEKISAETIDVSVPDGTERARLDKVLAAAVPDLSRGRIQSLLGAGYVQRLNDRRTIENTTHKVKPGEVYRITLPAPEDPAPAGETMPLTILHEDDDLIVIDKPAGLVVHPAPGHEGGTLVNALIAHCGDSLSGIGGVRRPGIVHRLDKDTSGVMVVAKNDAAHTALSERFAAHDIERAYLAFCWNAPRPRTGTIDAPLGRSHTNRKKQAITRGGRRAVTHYRVEKVFGSPTEPVASLIECRLETGRTHQIRVHMAHIGHAVMGDPLYGRGRRAKGLAPETRDILENLGRQALHARMLGFVHPRTGKPLNFTSAFPPELTKLLHSLDSHPAL